MLKLQKFANAVQDLILGYPMKTLIYATVSTSIPCAISHLSGGSLWAREVSLWVVSFYWGAVPLFLGANALILLPMIVWIRAAAILKGEAERNRQLDLREARISYQERRQAIASESNEF